MLTIKKASCTHSLSHTHIHSKKEQRAAMCACRLSNTHTKGAESKSDVRGRGSTAFFGERGRGKKKREGERKMLRERHEST